MLILAVAAPLRGGTREAVLYLQREVPRWNHGNRCFSCHNNGDGVRALLAAQHAGFTVKPEALADSLENLRNPGAWEQKTLAAVSFGAALAAGQPGLPDAAEWLARAQEPDGHWRVDEEKMAGSPVTYGPVLATWIARDTLRRAGAGTYAAAIGRADDWLRANPSERVVDVGSRLLALSLPGDVRKLAARQAPNGSWANEAFDTAIAVMALARFDTDAARRGRQFLLDTQLSAGGWAATTRPSGGDSYAQHISTTAWALMALLATERESQK